MTPMKDFLFLQLRDLPYFRAFLRVVESSYYQDLPLPAPVYDVGCGDGHFASLTFDKKIDVGLIPGMAQFTRQRNMERIVHWLKQMGRVRLFQTITSRADSATRCWNIFLILTRC